MSASQLPPHAKDAARAAGETVHHKGAEETPTGMNTAMGFGVVKDSQGSETFLADVVAPVDRSSRAEIAMLGAQQQGIQV